MPNAHTARGARISHAGRGLGRRHPFDNGPVIGCRLEPGHREFDISASTKTFAVALVGDPLGWLLDAVSDEELLDIVAGMVPEELLVWPERFYRDRYLLENPMPASWTRLWTAPRKGYGCAESGRRGAFECGVCSGSGELTGPYVQAHADSFCKGALRLPGLNRPLAHGAWSARDRYGLLRTSLVVVIVAISMTHGAVTNAQAGGWRVDRDRDRMTGAIAWFAGSNPVRSEEPMQPPFDGLESSVAFACNAQGEWVGIRFSKEPRPALYPHLVLDNTRTALAFLDNPVTEGWP